MKILFIILIYIIYYFKGLYYPLFGPKYEKNRNYNIYIIGDSLSGILCAWNLKKYGFNPTIISQNKKLENPFKTQIINDKIVPIMNYIWPKEKNEHWRELIDELGIKKKNINRSFYIVNDNGKYIHGINTELSIKYKYYISQWIKMVDFCKTMNKSFNINKQFNPLDIIQLRYITKLYKCDNSDFINDVIQTIYYDYNNILDYPISILEYINDILPIDNSRFPEYETFLNIEESDTIIDKLIDGIDIIYDCKIDNIKYNNKKWSIKTDKKELIADYIIYNTDNSNIKRLTYDNWVIKLLDLLTYKEQLGFKIISDNDDIKKHDKNYMTYIINGKRHENLSIWKSNTYIEYNNRYNGTIDKGKIKGTYINSEIIKLINKTQGNYGVFYLGELNLLNNRNDINIQIINGIKISMLIGAEYPFTRLIDKYKFI